MLSPLVMYLHLQTYTHLHGHTLTHKGDVHTLTHTVHARTNRVYSSLQDDMELCYACSYDVNLPLIKRRAALCHLIGETMKINSALSFHSFTIKD